MTKKRRSGSSAVVRTCIVALGLAGCGGGDNGGAPPGGNPWGAGAVSADAKPAEMPLVLQSVEPTSGIPRTRVDVKGAGFTKSSRVFWNGMELETVFQTPEHLTVTMPDTRSAQDIAAALEVRREDGQVQAWPVPMRVEAVPAPTSVDPGQAREGQRVRIHGARLQLAARVGMGSAMTAPFAVAADGSWLDFLVPATAPSGSVVVYDAKSRAFAAGHVQVTGEAVALNIENVELEQGQQISVSQPSQNPNFRLVALRPMDVRVRLAPDKAGALLRPEVRLTVWNDARDAQTFAMAGPEVLGTTSVAEDDLAGSYTYQLPGEWIGSGFQFEVAVNERRFPDSVTRFAYKPPVGVLGDATYIRMHVVPIAPDTGEKVDFDLDWFTANLREVYPLSEVDVVLEPPLAGPGTNTSLDWLKAVGSLRAASQPSNYDFYLGVMPYNGASGKGYQPGRVAVASHLWYQRQDYAINGVVMHEIGHNFGRGHSFDDKNFPYANNRLGGPWAAVFEKGKGPTLVDPAAWYDVMSYSYPKTVSDYTYRGAHDYLSKNLPWSARPTAVAGEELRQKTGTRRSTAGADSIYFSGSLNLAAEQASIDAPVRMEAPPDTVPMAPQALATSSDHVLEVVTQGGRNRYPLVLQPIGDGAQSDRHFELTVPAIEAIQSLRILRGNAVLQTHTATEAPRPPVVQDSGDSAADATAKPWGSYQVRDDKLVLRWDAARSPWLSIWQRTSRGLLPLSISASGGIAEVALRAPWSDTLGLVVSTTDGLNASLDAVDL